MIAAPADTLRTVWTTDPGEAVRALVAFANDLGNVGGGWVVCGRRDGAPPSEGRRAALKDAVLQACEAEVEPPLRPAVAERDQGGTPVLVFEQRRSRSAHRLRRGAELGSYFVRRGEQVGAAEHAEVLLLLGRQGAWDRSLAHQATPTDLDEDAIAAFLDCAALEQPVADVLAPDAELSPFAPSLCGRDPLDGSPRPRLGALLLFGRQPQRWASGAVTRLRVYRGTGRQGEPSLVEDFAGTLPEQAAAAVDAVSRVLGAGLAGPTLPRQSVHEAVVNALVHRDHGSPQPTRVTVFDDRVEVHSPGGLPPTVNVEGLGQGTAAPCWRNQALAWFFERLGLARGEGAGVGALQRSLAAAGFPPASFAATAHDVTCVLPRRPPGGAAAALDAVDDLLLQGHAERALSRWLATAGERPGEPWWELLADLLGSIDGGVYAAAGRGFIDGGTPVPGPATPVLELIAAETVLEGALAAEACRHAVVLALDTVVEAADEHVAAQPAHRRGQDFVRRRRETLAARLREALDRAVAEPPAGDAALPLAELLERRGRAGDARAVLAAACAADASPALRAAYAERLRPVVLARLAQADRRELPLRVRRRALQRADAELAVLATLGARDPELEAARSEAAAGLP